jgi:hypothetical protein
LRTARENRHWHGAAVATFSARTSHRDIPRSLELKKGDVQLRLSKESQKNQNQEKINMALGRCQIQNLVDFI